MSYIGTQPVPRATRVRTFGALATATNTIAIPGGFSPSNIEVFIDGLYVQPTDYDDSDGFNLVFITTLALGTEYVVMEARTFESANHYTKQEIQDAAFDFNTMPTVGGDPVVLSGSNADGEYTRFADGTQICRASTGQAGWSQISTSSEYIKLVDLPIAFINDNYIISGAIEYTLGTFTGRYFIGRAGSLSASSLTLQCYSGGGVLPVVFTAIGRWK
jgi:hypothetical protein